MYNYVHIYICIYRDSLVYEPPIRWQVLKHCKELLIRLYPYMYIYNYNYNYNYIYNYNYNII